MPDRQHAQGIRVLAVASLDELGRFESQWNDLVARCSTATPMSTFAWLYAYFHHFVKPPASWVCLLALRDDALVGVLPLVRSPGRSISLPNNPHAISVDAVFAPEVEQEAYLALLDEAFLQGDRTSAIVFRRIRDDSPTLSLATPGLYRHSDLAEQGAYLPVPPDFEEYRRSLSRNFRNNLNKAVNKLKRLPDVEISILSGNDADPALLPRFAAVEAASWKGEAETAIQCSPVLLDFYGDMVTHLHRAGWLEWQFLKTEGRPIAANLCIRLRRSLFLWKLGYDAEYSRCSPGSLLLEHVVRQASVEGTIDEIDLMTNQPWYNNWDMAWRPYLDFTGYRKRTFRGTAAYCGVRLKDGLRRFPLLRRIKRALTADAA
ncbi:MAG: GNAT family N-acetyltransferase [Gemmatimonadota bacterium]|nr:MAG: GNAT family N-acetyltransferase [Gemmatimonadota bacterium]